MSIRRWLVACVDEMCESLREAVSQTCGKGEQIELDFFDSAVDLRRQLLREHDAYVAIGPLDDGDISDVNLAAAVVRDGGARCVMLVRRHVSGSFMSRARQAGASLVAEARHEGVFLYPIAEVHVGGDPNDSYEEDRLMAQRSLSSAVVPTVSDEPIATNASAITDVPEVERTEILPTRRSLEEGRAPVVVVASGRGGVGKSTLVGLMGLVAKNWGMRVALVDLDLAQGNLRALLGAGRQGVIHVEGKRPSAVDELVEDAQSADQRMLLFGPCERPEDTDIASSLVRPLLDRIAQEVDVIIVDTSNTVTDAVADAMQMADRLVLLSDDMPGGLASLVRLSGLAVRLGVARARIVRVINHCDPRQPPNLQEGRAEIGLEMARIHQVMEGGIDVAELGAEGALADVMDECRELTASVATCLARLLGELGRLPDVPSAHEALEGTPKRRLLPFLHRQKEAS